MNHDSKKAFTIIELLVTLVISVIILGALSKTNLFMIAKSSQIQKKLDSTRTTNNLHEIIWNDLSRAAPSFNYFNLPSTTNKFISLLNLDESEANKVLDSESSFYDYIHDRNCDGKAVVFSLTPQDSTRTLSSLQQNSLSYFPVLRTKKYFQQNEQNKIINHPSVFYSFDFNLRGQQPILNKNKVNDVLNLENEENLGLRLFYYQGYMRRTNSNAYDLNEHQASERYALLINFNKDGSCTNVSHLLSPIQNSSSLIKDDPRKYLDSQFQQSGNCMADLDSFFKSFPAESGSTPLVSTEKVQLFKYSIQKNSSEQNSLFREEFTEDSKNNLDWNRKNLLYSQINAIHFIRENKCLSSIAYRTDMENN